MATGPAGSSEGLPEQEELRGCILTERQQVTAGAGSDQTGVLDDDGVDVGRRSSAAILQPKPQRRPAQPAQLHRDPSSPDQDRHGRLDLRRRATPKAAMPPMLMRVIDDGSGTAAAGRLGERIPDSNTTSQP